ncbi:MAG TPA: exodeoxyribonuclease III [Frankiaceae bacterium]|nr:exodeoxyribonuclease III [Frankiaceae bacterium]
MLLATWNVNSLTARLPRVLEFLATHQPDVVCLQETKVGEAAFPTETLAGAGYAAAHHSGGRWAGVAILTPLAAPPYDVVRGLPGEVQVSEARWVEASVGDLRVCSVYVVNGRALGTTQYAEKLAFLDAMRARLAELTAAGPVYAAGDANIAPEDRDVWDPSLFVGTTHTSRPERERLERILGAGLVDAYRVAEPDTVGFTYWDYAACTSRLLVVGARVSRSWSVAKCPSTRSAGSLVLSRTVTRTSSSLSVSARCLSVILPSRVVAARDVWLEVSLRLQARDVWSEVSLRLQAVATEAGLRAGLRPVLGRPERDWRCFRCCGSGRARRRASGARGAFTTESRTRIDAGLRSP